MKKLGIIQDSDLWFRIADRKTRRPIPGNWNIYRTYTGAAAGLRAFRRNGEPARCGPHVTPEAVKAARRVRACEGCGQERRPGVPGYCQR